MLPLATHYHTHYHLHPFYFVLFKFKDLVAKQHPTNIDIYVHAYIHAYIHTNRYVKWTTHHVELKLHEVQVWLVSCPGYMQKTSGRERYLRLWGIS